MSTEDFVKQFQDLILEESQKLIGADSVAASNEMMAKMVDALEAATAQGIELPPEVLEHVNLLKTMQEQTQAVEAAMAAGESEAALTLAQKIAIDGGARGVDYEPEPDIFDAIEMCDLDAVKACLAAWDVNQGHGEFDKSALYHAVSNCGFEPSFPIMHTLLDAGADPNRGLGQSYNVIQGLGFGIYQPSDIDDLVLLIQRCITLGAVIEQRSENLNWTPLHTALMEWNVPVAAALLRAGADSNAATTADMEGCAADHTCLGMTCAMPELFELLLDHGADPDLTDAFGDTVRARLTHNLQQSTEGDYASALAQSQAILDRRTSAH